MGGKKKEKKVKEPRMSFNVYQQQSSTTLSLLTTAYSRDCLSVTLASFIKTLTPLAGQGQMSQNGVLTFALPLMCLHFIFIFSCSWRCCCHFLCTRF